jgi:hypothetical protein
VLLGLTGVLGIWWPRVALPISIFLTASLVGETQGQFGLIRWFFPRSPSYNLVVRLPAEKALGTVVLCTPLDLPRFVPPSSRWLRPSMRPSRIVLAGAGALTAMQLLRFFGEPLGELTVQMYYASLGLFVLFAVVAAASFRRSDEGADDASGPTVLLELTRRLVHTPIPSVDVIIAFTGCGHAFQSGAHSLLRVRRETMAQPVLVVALDQPGRVPLRAVAVEGSAISQPHRPTGPALVERLRWAGIALPVVRRYGATDARAALVMGFRALALSGGSGTATVASIQRSCDVIETLVRWNAQDVALVAGDRPVLQEVAQALRDIQAEAWRRRDAAHQKPSDTEVEAGHDEPSDDKGA